eukprot:scaffold27063_cov64-Phaeocystis_antarctica.AAC.12
MAGAILSMVAAVVCWLPITDSPATVGTSDRYSGWMYRRTSWPARTSCARSTSGGCEWRVRVEGASGGCDSHCGTKVCPHAKARTQAIAVGGAPRRQTRCAAAYRRARRRRRTRFASRSQDLFERRHAGIDAVALKQRSESWPELALRRVTRPARSGGR